jgi:hypothetical protein
MAALFRLELDADHASADQETERYHQRQDDEHDRETAFCAAPSLPVGNPILHVTVSPVARALSAKIYMTDQREKNSTELWPCDDKKSLNPP